MKLIDLVKLFLATWYTETKHITFCYDFQMNKCEKLHETRDAFGGAYAFCSIQRKWIGRDTKIVRVNIYWFNDLTL